MPAQKVVELDYAPRVQFMPFHERTQRWACMVCHRRAGKTVAVLNDQIKKAITIKRPDARLAYIAPYRGQAKDVAWSYLKKFSQPLWGAEPSESELKVTLLNSATLRLYGGDNPDAIRGGYLDDVALDEFGDHRPSLWRDVVRPMLADRGGTATFIGTPKGKNEFWEVSQTATKDPANYYHMILPASKSGILPQPELDAMLLAMGTDRYMQELECSFEAAIHGAFYAEELRIAADENRIRPIQVERAVRVHTSWDLGIRDSTAIWFIQCVGTERRLIDYYEASGVGLDHYVEILESKKRSKSNPNGYLYGTHYFPHDIAVRELTSGRSRRETLEDMGIEVEIVPSHNVLDGINATRRMLDHAFIDNERAFRGLECLRNYRREFNERLKDWAQNPLHDWSSHGCFTSDTRILTYNGKCRFDDLPERGEVWTLYGWKKYLNPRITRRNVQLVEVHFASGFMVRCTEDHLFLTDSGWKSAVELLPDMLIRSSLTRSRNISMASSIAFGRMKDILPRAASAFTSWFGHQFSGLYRTDATSITGTTSLSITPSITSNVCLSRSTWSSHGSAVLSGGEFKPLRQWRANGLLSGTLRKLGFFGTEGMPSVLNRGQNGSGKSGPVSNAGLSSIALLEKMVTNKSSVLSPASLSLTGRGWKISILLIASVPNVVKGLWSRCVAAVKTACSARLNARPKNTIAAVRRATERSDVWCLTVPDVGHFSLENGAVVHNCDALRQFAVGHDEPLPERQEDRHRRSYNAPQTAWGV